MLLSRILSALVLLPLALAAVWLGGLPFLLLVVVAALLMAWEWASLVSGRFARGGIVLALMALLVPFLAYEDRPQTALAAILAAAALSPLLDGQKGRSPLWLACGAFYIGLPVLSLIRLRADGLVTVLWLLLVVWATDIGAYATGRLIGGPKLMPAVSPKKTWAGLLGGVISAALVGFAVSHRAHLSLPAIGLGAISAGLAVFAQAGDLGESWVKRHFGVKDSSRLIPGHGGVLDRLDGLVAAAPLVALIGMMAGGGLERWS